MAGAETLTAMYDAMRQHFGPRNWWPSLAGDDAPAGQLEICVGAILTQNTNWGNVEKALGNLHAAGLMSVEALAELPREQLAELIRPAGYYNVKAKRLGNFVSHVRDTFGDDISAFLARPAYTLREELLGINGIGRETADSMILYAAGLAVFVVDTYTARVFGRHGLISPEDDYDGIQEFFESSLPEDVAFWNDFHAQIVAVGKNFCKPTPRCPGCPLESFPHDLEEF